MIKPKLYTGQALFGEWQVTRKLDGVRMLRDEEGNPVSRSGKPLYNLGWVCPGVEDAEVFSEDWDTTVSLVRTHSFRDVPRDAIYPLDPPDPRLVLETITDPSPLHVERLLREALARGDEGLVLRQGFTWLKVKPVENYDVVVRDITPGKGKYEGMVGALVTDRGKVSGMDDEDRAKWKDGSIIGKTIEVECMSLTKNGKFRHPRIVRVRWDKEEAQLEAED